MAACAGEQGDHAQTRQADDSLLVLNEDEAASLEDSPSADSPIVPVDGVTYPNASKDYTVMVYVVGTDLETNYGSASADLKEMTEATFDMNRVNVVVYVGGTQRWHANIPNDCNSVLEVKPGGLELVAKTNRSLNMGEPETLAAFLRWASEQYPSQHQALVLWDHGAGPARGYGFDQLYGMDPLTLDEQAQALSSAGYGADHKLDWVGFDACLMDSVEVLQVWDDFASFFVGSQELEDGYGWNYAFLSKLCDDMSPAAVTASIVEAFDSFHAGDAYRKTQPSTTLAAVDLSALPSIVDSIDALSKVALKDFEKGDFSVVGRARGECRSFGAVSGSATSGGAVLVDLADLARFMADAHPHESAAVVAAVDKAVIANSTNLVGANGVSLYFPVTEGSADVEPPTENCATMLARYSEQGQSASQIEWQFPEFEHSGGYLSIGLDVNQNRSLASASYTILGDFQGRGYLPIMSNVRIFPDENGVLKIPEDPQLIYTDGANPSVVPLTQVDASPERQVYRSDSIGLLPGTEFVSAPNGEQGVMLLLAQDKKGKVTVSSAMSNGSEFAMGGRANIDLPAFKDMMLYYGGWQYPDRAEDGTLLPSEQWTKREGRYVWNEVPLDGEVSFKARKVSEAPGTCVMQVVLTDVNGQMHASELLPLAGPEYGTATVKTAQGEMLFEIEGDHAVLSSYDGTDEQLEIPSQVNGLPVTRIGDGALRGCWDLKALILPSTVESIGYEAIACYELETLDLGTGLKAVEDKAVTNLSKVKELALPEGLQSVGRGAFRGLGVTSIRLPSTLEHLGEGAFTGCEALESFEVADGCSAVVAVDGALFSADASTLVAFPAGRQGSYLVPKGTTTIGYGAFAATSLDTIVVCEGVTTIENCAFFCSELGKVSHISALSLPDSLERVGSFAFGSTVHASDFAESPYIEELRLGSNLTSIGESAFTGLRVGRFFVHPSNESFSSPGGFLANKAGDTILEAPQGMGQVVVVPDGVTTIGSYLFNQYADGTDFILPRSLSRISQWAFACHYDDVEDDSSLVYDVVLHCEEGSPAAEFAETHDIQWDAVTDPEMLTSAERVVQKSGMTFTFAMYPDHAVLHGFAIEGVDVDRNLVIPSEVDGVPVTRIDGLSETALGIDSWESVTLPASLESIDYESIPKLRADEGFAIDGESAAFMVKDGVLFSADGSTLVAFSLHNLSINDKDSVFAYEIPAKTKYIGEGAFYESQLERVVFPSSLRVVRSRAFTLNSLLTDIQMNEGLERIEDYAFRCPATHIELPSSLTYIGASALRFDGYDGFALPESLRLLGNNNLDANRGLINIGSDTLKVGPRLSELGYGALSSVAVTAFEVDSRNETFTAIDGLLCSKDGKTLIRVPAGLTGKLHIPDGVEKLDPGCLNNVVGLTDVYFPDSAMGVDAYTDYTDDSPAYKVTFHCKRGSEAAHYAQEHGIAWTE